MMYRQLLSRSLCSPLVCLLLFILQTTGAAPFDCYVCSYTRSSDPTVNYDCASMGNTSIVRACQKPYMCKTLVLFNQGMNHIRSVTRDCLPQTDNCVGDKCCNMNGQYPLCEQKCRSDRCNDYNAESWLKQDSGETPGDGKDPNTGTSVKQTCGLVVALIYSLII